MKTQKERCVFLQDTRHTFQDRQQASVAVRAGAEVLVIVDDDHTGDDGKHSLFTPDRIDPACSIPVLGVRKVAADTLENYVDGSELKLTVHGGRSR